MRKKLSLRERLEKLSTNEPEAGKRKPILKAKKVTGVGKPEIDKMVSEIERDLGIEQSKTEKIEVKTIKNFEISSGKIKGISSLAAVCDKSEKQRLGQILYLKDTPEIELNWTVIRDPFAEEFAMVVKEGLTQIKTRPLIFGMGVDDGIILASHMKGYTLTLGCYDMKIGNVVEIFISLLRYVEKRMGSQ